MNITPNTILACIALLLVLAFAAFVVSSFVFFTSMIVELRQASVAVNANIRTMGQMVRVPGVRVLTETTQTELVCFEFFRADAPDEQEDVSELIGRGGVWTQPVKRGGSTGQ